MKFLNTDDLKDFKLIWVTATNPANVGVQKTITSFNKVSGLITLSSAMSANITANDTFIILPVTVKNVVTYLNNTSTSTFSLNGVAEMASDGTLVQL